MIDEALAAHRRGWAVIPLHGVAATRCTCGRPDCPSPGKHPRLRWERWQTECPSADRIRAWWRRWPHANIGVVTGAVSGVVVLDVDPRHGGDRALAALEDELGAVPATVETATGGAGRHLWFRHPGGHVGSGALAPGVDLKADGGLVVIPPSTHLSGRRYAWAPGRSPDDLPLAAVPAWTVLRPHRAPNEPTATARPPAVVRTGTEQQTFADAWSRVGIELLPGDQMYVCPFHADHRPSLHIDADGCRWHCFGCGRGGGIVALQHLSGMPSIATPRGRLAGTATAPCTLAGGAEVPVVGESWHQDALLELTGGQRHYGGVDLGIVAELVPDPDNRFDPAAVAVVIRGQVVGHLPRSWARRLRPLVDRARRATGAATCRARIRGGWDRGGGDVGFFGVTLDVDPVQPLPA
ncbi:MAG: bifunctional DNA primase/polymerase [Acidimicrobiales bacterium]